MTVNERWVVYPLLFLSLGVAMRDKVVPRVEEEIVADQVRCNRLMVAEADCNRLTVAETNCRVLHVAGPKGTGGVRLGVLPDGSGRLEVHSGSDQTLVAVSGGAGGSSGTIETFDAERRPQVRLQGSGLGGVIATFDREGNVLVLGRAGSQAGLWGVTPHLRDARPLTYPWPVGTPKPSLQSMPPQPAPDTTPRMQ